jgi:transcriptional regulator with XRE-family HTH domain
MLHKTNEGAMKTRIVDEELKKRVGRVIRILRTNIGMEQLDLALAVGFGHASSISQIESGKRSLYMDNLLKIANALNINVSALLEMALAEEELSEEKIKQIHKITAYVLKEGKHTGAILSLIESNAAA